MHTSIKFNVDESLESFLLRLSQDQGYERFSHFAQDGLIDTLEEHQVTAGAFPFELDRVNIYHAHGTSQMRARVFTHLERMFELGNMGLLRFALSHSKAHFSPQFKAIHRFGSDYPFVFLRKRFTPICPHCLREDSYIRQNWHFIPNQVCERHGCVLVHHCPECQSRLEYQKSECISHCECGFDLRHATAKCASEPELLIASWLSGDKKVTLGRLNSEMTRSERYGFLLWYVNRYGDVDNIGFESFVNYCNEWPQPLFEELDLLCQRAEVVRVRPWHKMFFNDVFGELLHECRSLPNRQLGRNVVLVQVLAYFTQLVSAIPISSKGEVSDILLSLFEASTLLSCTTDEIYRLYEFGEIKAAIRPRIHIKVANHESIFTLRSVVETKLSRMCSESDGLGLYLPEW